MSQDYPSQSAWPGPGMRWAIWTLFVVAWTVALELPFPHPTLPATDLFFSLKMFVAKSLHVAVYAFLTVLSGWVPMAAPWRVVMMFFLMAHASVTELLQEAWEPMMHRGGSLRDVAFDQLGIALGTLVSWRWWSGK